METKTEKVGSAVQKTDKAKKTRTNFDRKAPIKYGEVASVEDAIRNGLKTPEEIVGATRLEDRKVKIALKKLVAEGRITFVKRYEMVGTTAPTMQVS